MTAPATPIYIPPKAQLGFLALRRSCIDAFSAYNDYRYRLLQIDRAYMREVDQTSENWKAKIANRVGDSSKFQNITVPIILPQVESAVEYQTEVFCTGYPMFSFTGPPQQWDAVEQMNVIMEDNSQRGGWVKEFIMAFRDGFKYNTLAMECDWASITMPVLETDLQKSIKEGSPKEIIWSGNVVKRLDPYNTFWDRRVQPSQVCTDGEFAGYHKLYSRTGMKSFINGLDCKILQNVIPALESQQQNWGISQDTPDGFSVPQIRPDLTSPQIAGQEPDWMSWVGAADADMNKMIKYKNTYILTVLYVRIIPADFDLRVSAPQTPQIWKLYYVNNQVLLGAKRMTNAHNNLPILLGQPMEDGLGYQTKSLAENVSDFQDVTSAMLNSVIAARRRAISDRTIYDPSKISEQHINNPNPSAKIPVRPAAYGKPLSESVYAFPFRDDQSGIILQELQQVAQMADMASGQNRARRGQFQKGNKTLHEYQDVQDNSTGRDRMCSIGLETSVMTPMKEIMKTNILQYQGTGVIFSKALQKDKNIDPVLLRNAALSFNISDGLLPSSKIMNTEAIQGGFQTLAQIPALAAGYNMAPMFSYLMKANNADLSPFEKGPAQIAFEQAMQQWQNLAQMTIEKGGDPSKLPPQPLPQQYNYDPSAAPPTPAVNPAVSPNTVAGPVTPSAPISQAASAPPIQGAK